MYPTLGAGWNVPETAGKRALLLGRTSDLTTGTNTARQRNQFVSDRFDRLDNPNIERVRPADFLCDTECAGRCLNSWDGRSLYVDDTHLSDAGTALIIPAILKRILAVVRP